MLTLVCLSPVIKRWVRLSAVSAPRASLRIWCPGLSELNRCDDWFRYSSSIDGIGRFGSMSFDGIFWADSSVPWGRETERWLGWLDVAYGVFCVFALLSGGWLLIWLRGDWGCASLFAFEIVFSIMGLLFRGGVVGLPAGFVKGLFIVFEELAEVEVGLEGIGCELTECSRGPIGGCGFTAGCLRTCSDWCRVLAAFLASSQASCWRYLSCVLGRVYSIIDRYLVLTWLRSNR
jgi:hypothetical protein